MAWTVIEKRFAGRTPNPVWSKFPAIRLTKHGISVNAFFLEAFGFKAGSHVLVMVDSESGKIGFRSIGDQDDRDTAYKFREHGQGTALFLGCKRVIEAFSDRIGDVFRARLNHGERVIEVDLNDKGN